MIQLTFHGAAETVTGSKYLIEVDQTKVLIDCGLFQGLKALREKNWEPLPFAPRDVECVVLTHAHLDHTGYLPRLVRNGFQGPTYCTPATAELSKLLLLDAAKIQQEDADYANRKGFSKHHPAVPLFDIRDAEQALKALSHQPMRAWFPVAGPIRARYHDTGHLLGAAMIEVEIARAGQGQPALRILFSGDVGRYDAPLYPDPSPPPACDFLICESTYGNREHADEPVLDLLAHEVLAGLDRGGMILVPAFAIGRAQQLIYLLRILVEQKRIPAIPIFLDSPMAVEATHIYKRYRADHDLSERQGLGMKHVLSGPNIHLADTVGESKQINAVNSGGMIIASSGMMTGGRILHHLQRRLPDPRNTIMLGGFMAEGTRGRDLEDGKHFLRMHGRDVPVRAAVVRISGLSGHADRSELLRWLSPLPAPKQTFFTHGEKPSAESLAAEVSKRGWTTVVPHLGQTVELT